MIDSRLNLLIAVCEYGTVTAAAEALYRSPSGVSKQLKELAAELDVDLLERHGRRVRLTPAGQRLVTHARALNAQWETALSDTTAAARQLCGPVTLGGFPTAISSLLTPAVVRLRDRHRLLQPVIKETFSSETLTALESGAIDLGLFVAGESTSHVADSHVEVISLLDDPIDLLVSEDHRFATSDQVSLADAADEEWISGHAHQDAYIELLAATRAIGYAPRVAHYAQELTATTAMVAAGLGISAVPRIAMSVSHPKVVQIPLTGSQIPRRRILFALRRGSRDNPRIAAAITALRDAATDSQVQQREPVSQKRPEGS
ncbi:DNA-binding transcriptional regulator, LysR family [Brevibacterium sandarakinum]|uniref:DNA-binding transcriptional regulator, LysR family n=1 Tax=Brevibacterium sandarakinum TaxID=629680 RepID=A0A1H1XBJ4_BRESA|nr:LysR family transcriptional regulator [Brevibacterium sandarakinum]SDT06713.1 DNA-binding transcriptional regulator, LysR family [Brevibacterium sandarakinum]